MVHNEHYLSIMDISTVNAIISFIWNIILCVEKYKYDDGMNLENELFRIYLKMMFNKETSQNLV
jgi:hypothetical protein